ncbi:hypothetical protein JCM10207_000628 [Rhodosporidiobolus poonsookiae]
MTSSPANRPSSCRGLSIFAPISYLAFLVGSLWLFSKVYRKRQANKPASEPWFPQHKSRDVYVSLLSLDPPPPRPILVAALLRRAMDDVKLIWSIRDAKTSLTTLLQKGQVGDELWEHFLVAEKELEAEILEVVGEANTFEPGYGQKIFNVASDMVSHERWKEVYTGIAKKREEEAAKHASTIPPAAVLAPTAYLTPSSLTLAPSNPLPAVGTSPAPGAASSLTAPSPPLSSASTPVPSSTPAPAPAPAPLASQADAPPEPAGETEDKAVAPESEKPASPAPAPAPSATPSKSPAAESPATTPGGGKKTPAGNKKGKRKPQVKGGR